MCGVSGEVCWHEGEGCGERNEGGAVKCVRMWGPNTLPPTLPHISSLTFPYISPYLPHTPTHFPTPPLIPLLTSSLPPPTPQHTFLRLLPHLPHLLKVWRSYYVTKFLWRIKLLWRSYHVAKLLATFYSMFLEKNSTLYSLCQNSRICQSFSHSVTRTQVRK